MISGTLFAQLLFTAVVVIFKSGDCIPVPLPKQNISPGGGFIPVFIRVGDTPLESIDPLLAEAFEVYAVKNGRVGYPRPNMITTDINKQQSSTQIFLKELDDPVQRKKLPQHIQKIPKNN